MDQVDAVVIGAGVVGLAIARRLANAGREVLVLERAPTFGTETSARNSEVIHAGLYYDPGSLKARFCVSGRDQMYAYLRDRNLPHLQCGKLIVASDAAQAAKLAAIAETAERSGAGVLRHLTGAEARALEPELDCHSALISPATGIVDSHALMLSLLGDAEDSGTVLVPHTEVVALRPNGERIEVETRQVDGDEGFALSARTVVNAAGLWASQVAAATRGLGAPFAPQQRFARGTWFAVPGRSVFSRLIYPVPEPGGLGIHLTIDLGGGMRFGPDVEWIDGIDYRLSDARADAFATAVQRYWPGVQGIGLQPVSCGIRPKLSGPGDAAADFRIDGPATHGIPGLVNLFGIESPGLTSSMAIADHVADLLAGA